MTGCASIITGSSQEMTFKSQPEEATVSVNGRILGKTPLTVRLDKKSNQAVIFEKDGYKSQTMQLETRINGWFWGNIVLGGLIGSTTDGLSGAVHEYSPIQYFVTLPPAGNNPVDTLTSQKMRAKDFIVLNYNNIMKDLAKSSGEYYISLMNALKIEASNWQVAAGKIKSLSETYNDIPTFADKAIEMYIK
jgi:hypothetical protein